MRVLLHWAYVFQHSGYSAVMSGLMLPIEKMKYACITSECTPLDTVNSAMKAGSSILLTHEHLLTPVVKAFKVGRIWLVMLSIPQP